MPTTDDASKVNQDNNVVGFTSPTKQDFDVSDPWGAPAALSTPSTSVNAMVVPQALRKQSLSNDWEQDGWDGNMVKESVHAEKSSHTIAASQPQADGSTWDITSPAGVNASLPLEEESPEVSEEDDISVPVPRSPTTPYLQQNPLPDPSSPESSSPRPAQFGSPSTVTLPPDPITDDPAEGFSSPGPSSLPQSPTFGEFGGFSGGFGDMGSDTGYTGGANTGFTGSSMEGGFGTPRDDGDGVDPWGGGAGLGWGGDNDKLPTSLAAPVVNDSDGEGDDVKGWGGAGGRPAPANITKTEDEIDWEEAQRRIRLKQERAVRLVQYRYGAAKLMSSSLLSGFERFRRIGER